MTTGVKYETVERTMEENAVTCLQIVVADLRAICEVKEVNILGFNNSDGTVGPGRKMYMESFKVDKVFRMFQCLLDTYHLKMNVPLSVIRKSIKDYPNGFSRFTTKTFSIHPDIEGEEFENCIDLAFMGDRLTGERQEVFSVKVGRA